MGLTSVVKWKLISETAPSTVGPQLWTKSSSDALGCRPSKWVSDATPNLYRLYLVVCEYPANSPTDSF